MFVKSGFIHTIKHYRAEKCRSLFRCSLHWGSAVFRFVTKARSKAEITGGRANWPSQNLPPASQNTDVNK